MSIKQEHTPLMQQYHEIRQQYPDTLLLFQVGDFYELFFDDAKKASAFLGIALTARGKNKGEPIPLCGVPLHALDHYMIKLVKGGFNVAVCNQLEPPKPGSLVRRGVTQVLTPGTLTDAKLLDAKSPSYLFSFFPTTHHWGILFGELLTAQLHATIIPAASERVLESELIRFFPDEVLIPNNKLGKSFQSHFKRLGYFTTVVNFDDDQSTQAQSWVQQQFKSSVQKSIEEQEALRLALYYFYAYLLRNQKEALSTFHQLHLYQPDDFLILDSATQKNLELVTNAQDGGRNNTLFAVMDGATTAMGSRMIKKWIARPLIKEQAIVQRQDAIETVVRDVALMQMIKQSLAAVGDLERVVGRIALRRAQLHDYLLLSQALAVVPQLHDVLPAQDAALLFGVIKNHLGNFDTLKLLLDVALNDDASKDWIIKTGFDQQLDTLRDLVGSGNHKIIELERSEQTKTGIQSLKIRYNQVHGYYIEVTKANIHAVPDYYIRQQTLVGRERFIIPALQQLQADIMRARNEIEQVEQAVFERIKQEVAEQVVALRKLAHGLAHLDALFGLAKIAYDNGYIRPHFNDNREIAIIEGRHPVVEHNLDGGFIPNDTALTDEQSLWIITGPNMGGKSTYLRQVALISIMAQCGSFVPAKRVNLALLDRIFTRIGAGDNLVEGKSTFLVEMEETASICTHATQNSLVILDEVGRGTSTFDGLAIAQAVVEYLYEVVQARCLFATHYHELTQLHTQFPGIASYYAASKKTTNGILFLYKIVAGVADGSFGVEVAKLAQLPPPVIKRSQELLHMLTALPVPAQEHALLSSDDGQRLLLAYEQALQENKQLQANVGKLQEKLHQQDGFIKALQEVDFDELSPKKAFDLLWRLREADLKALD